MTEPTKRRVTVEEIEAQLLALPKAKMNAVLKQTVKQIPQCFIPSAGPQTAAFYSPADILLFGGSAAGGKSALGIGLALTAHKKSLIMRPQYTELTDLIDKTLKFYGTRDGFNGSSPPSLKTKDGRFLQFGACANPGDEYSWQGQEKDFYFFDEVVNFREEQVKFIMTWNRTDLKNQRVRTLFASNPPVNTQGDWIIGMFRPWLDVTHPNPAKDGELRWFVTDNQGKDIEVESSNPIEDGYRPDGTPRLLIPKSRTFIRSSIDDNPYIDGSYKATLDAMKEPYRSALRDGNFMLARKDEENQLIPTAWVREAQARWTPMPPPNVPMCAMGVDVAAGGDDETIISPRYDGYFSNLIIFPGSETPFPQDVAAKVLRYRKGNAIPVIDCGGGYGGGVVRHLQDNGIESRAHKGAEKSTKRTKDRLHPFANKRAEVYYRFMEALDPSQDGGSTIALPNDTKLMSDLCSIRFQVTSRGIQLESKEDMKKRIGRSPDCFVAGTMVATPLGARGIETLQVGDKVVTPYGTRKIIAVHSQYCENIYTAKYKGKTLLQGKPSHRIFTWEKGWIRLDSIGDSVTLDWYSSRGLLLWRLKNLFYTMGRNTGFKAQVDIINRGEKIKMKDFFIEEYGRTLMEKSPMECTFTILMETGVTIGLRIWSRLMELLMQGCTWLKDTRMLITKSKPLNGSWIITTWQKLGILLQKELNGIGRMVKIAGSGARQFLKNVNSAKAIILPEWKRAGSVQENACKDLASVTAILTPIKETALNVKQSSLETNTGFRNVVQKPAPIDLELKGEMVYNLTLDYDNVYYANGVLVENCGDAVVLAWSYGETIATQKNGEWITGVKARPQAVMGYANRRRER